MGEVREMEAHECEQLLRSQIFGRVAMTTPEGPEIVPVNYRVVDDAVWVRTGEDSQLARWADQARLAFEIDLVDHARWRGWSVVAHGTAAVVSQAPAGETPGPRPWASGARECWVTLPWTSISGRQLGGSWDLFSALPARLVES